MTLLTCVMFTLSLVSTFTAIETRGLFDFMERCADRSPLDLIVSQFESSTVESLLLYENRAIQFL